MTTQRTTERMSGAHSYTREGAEPFAIRSLRETFESYPPHKQEQIRSEVRQKLIDEARSHEFAARTDRGGKRPGSALARMAWDVYGIRAEDL